MDRDFRPKNHRVWRDKLSCLFLIVILTVIVTACASSSLNTPLYSAPLNTSTIQATNTVLSPTWQPRNTYTPSFQILTPSPSIIPSQTITAGCLSIRNTLPSRVHLDESILLLNRKTTKISEIKLSSGEQTFNVTANPDLQVEKIATSPNGLWVTYEYYDLNTPLLIASANHKQEIRVEWKWPGDLGRSLLGWIDNEHLVFVRFLEGGYLGSTVVLNPFKREWHEFNLANLDYMAKAMNSVPLIFASSNLMPDPSLRLLVYPMQDNQASRYVVLKDLQSRQIVAKIQDFKHFGNDPLWAVNGKDFLIVLQGRPGTYENSVEDLFRVTREGSIEQITNFSEYFRHTEISAERRSPDGQKVIFWLDKEAESLSGQWTILNLDKPNEYFCVSVEDEKYQFPLEPIWSPDSRYAVITNTNMNDKGPVVLIDTVDKWAAKITEDIVPQGWFADQ